jgi:Uma2 family endonuclease
MTETDETGLLTRNPWVVRRKINVTEYYRMAEAGIIAWKDRIELIEGEIVVMSPAGSPHAGTINTLTRLLVTGLGSTAVVSVQNPLRLDDYNEPEPDFAVLRARDDDYRGATPGAADVLLVIEVADSSLRYDRSVKATLYARYGIPEFWIVDVNAGKIEVYRDPVGDRYMSVSEVDQGGLVVATEFPGVSIPAAALFQV